MADIGDMISGNQERLFRQFQFDLQNGGSGEYMDPMSRSSQQQPGTHSFPQSTLPTRKKFSTQVTKISNSMIAQ
eukprot:CAMPEP_0170501798 /NCGR_PEP_ID=MMETSP0208-20121228/39447_1 /TAXON_ID=197538 /ORGANISM="Strombidium inclinatum, Strain S3" /LENGTH=73 /DNA_ID=CAMNT_0010780517 /DNA_START=15 /DNA_END=236 /DNA_ORIENTATION=+